MKRPRLPPTIREHRKSLLASCLTVLLVWIGGSLAVRAPWLILYGFASVGVGFVLFVLLILVAMVHDPDPELDEERPERKR